MHRHLTFLLFAIWAALPCASRAADCESIIPNANEKQGTPVTANSLILISQDDNQLALVQDTNSQIHILDAGTKPPGPFVEKVNSLALKLWGASHVISWIGYKIANVARAGGHHAWYTDSYTNSIMNFTAIGLAHSFLNFETKASTAPQRMQLAYFVSAVAAIGGTSVEISPFDAQDFTLQLVSSAAYPLVYWLSVKWANRKPRSGNR